MFTQDSSQVLKSQRGLPGSYFQVKEVPRDLSLLASETEAETYIKRPSHTIESRVHVDEYQLMYESIPYLAKLAKHLQLRLK